MQKVFLKKNSFIFLGMLLTLLAGSLAFGSTVTLRPNGTGSQTNISAQYPSSGSHYDKVDEESADDSSTYVYTSSSSLLRDVYALPDSGVSSGTITGVTVYYRIMANSSYGYYCYARAAIKTNGYYYEGSTTNHSSSTWTTYSYSWSTNPATGQAWTWSEINALEAGVSLWTYSSCYCTVYCTQVYVEVNYTPNYLDSTSNNNDGSDYVSATGKTGKIGSGQEFDGTNDYIDIGDDKFESDNTGTITAWVKLASTGAYRGIFTSSVTAGANMVTMSINYANYLYAQYFTGATHNAMRGNTVLDTNWHHVAVTTSGSAWSLYIDGVAQTLTVIAGSNILTLTCVSSFIMIFDDEYVK